MYVVKPMIPVPHRAWINSNVFAIFLRSREMTCSLRVPSMWLFQVHSGRIIRTYFPNFHVKVSSEDELNTARTVEVSDISENETEDVDEEQERCNAVYRVCKNLDGSKHWTGIKLV